MNASITSTDDRVEDIDDMLPSCVRCRDYLNRMVREEEADRFSRSILREETFKVGQVVLSRILRWQCHRKPLPVRLE